jgi:hypothetical protein
MKFSEKKKLIFANFLLNANNGTSTNTTLFTIPFQKPENLHPSVRLPYITVYAKRFYRNLDYISPAKHMYKVVQI